MIWHEAAHATISEHLCPGSVVLVSALAGLDESEGFTKVNDEYIEAKLDFLEMEEMQILVKLAGRAALDIKFGIPDMGSEDDLSSAVQCVSSLVQDLGYTGLSSVDASYHNSEALNQRQEIAVMTLLEEYSRKVRRILIENFDILEKMAQELAEKKILVATDIEKIFKDHPGS